MAKKHIIWTNDIAESDLEYARENLVENGIEDINDEMSYNTCRENIDLYYEDEKINLNKPLHGRVLCIADLGLWNGRRSGYRIMGANLNEVLKAFQGDYCEVYFDGRNICATDTHHDGTNHYTFREIREDKNIDNLLGKLYNGTATSRDIATYTKSLAPYACEIYGWKYAYARKPNRKAA